MKVPPFVNPKTIRWDTLQQIVRIVMHIVATLLVKDGLEDDELFQAAVGGLASLIAWLWWGKWEFYRPAPPETVATPDPAIEEEETVTTVTTVTKKPSADVPEDFPETEAKKETKK